MVLLYWINAVTAVQWMIHTYNHPEHWFIQSMCVVRVSAAKVLHWFYVLHGLKRLDKSNYFKSFLSTSPGLQCLKGLTLRNWLQFEHEKSRPFNIVFSICARTATVYIVTTVCIAVLSKFVKAARWGGLIEVWCIWWLCTWVQLT